MDLAGRSGSLPPAAAGDRVAVLRRRNADNDGRPRGREKPLLVSRSEELVGVPPEILARYDVSVMEENAENEDGEADDESDQASRPLSGLHAKAFIQEIGWETAITSAPATRPAPHSSPAPMSRCSPPDRQAGKSRQSFQHSRAGGIRRHPAPLSARRDSARTERSARGRGAYRTGTARARREQPPPRLLALVLRG